MVWSINVTPVWRFGRDIHLGDGEQMDEQVTYRQQVNFCGKPRCRKCRDGVGHGPYWYAYHHTSDGRKERVYIGKNLPPGVMNAGNQNATSQGGGRATGSAQSATSQGGGKPRPYPTTKLPPNPVQGTGDPGSSLNPVEQYGEIDAVGAGAGAGETARRGLTRLPAFLQYVTRNAPGPFSGDSGVV